MDDFVAGYHCRYIIIDCVMDRRMDRVEYKEGEEVYNIYQKNQESDLPNIKY
jgi:hypothetical protein